MIMPRLPASVIMKGKYQLIPEDRIVGGVIVEPTPLPGFSATSWIYRHLFPVVRWFHPR